MSFSFVVPSRGRDVLKEVRHLPAPQSCSTSSDGSFLNLTFYEDYKLLPSSTYFFVPWSAQSQKNENISCHKGSEVGQLSTQELYDFKEWITDIDSVASLLSLFMTFEFFCQPCIFCRTMISHSIFGDFIATSSKATAKSGAQWGFGEMAWNMVLNSK